MARTRGAAKLSAKRRQEEAEKNAKEAKTASKSKVESTVSKNKTTAGKKAQAKQPKARKSKKGSAGSSSKNAAASDPQDASSTNLCENESASKMDRDTAVTEEDSISASAKPKVSQPVSKVVLPSCAPSQTAAARSMNTLDKKPAPWGSIVVGGRSVQLPWREEVQELSEKATTAEGKPGADIPIGTTAGGKPVSGRWWKPVANKPKSASVHKAKGKKRQAAWLARKSREKDIKDAVDLQKELKKMADERKTEERERSEARKKLREENERKSQVVQAITNTKKLKKMSRKQLRQIEKR